MEWYNIINILYEYSLLLRFVTACNADDLYVTFYEYNSGLLIQQASVCKFIIYMAQNMHGLSVFHCYVHLSYSCVQRGFFSSFALELCTVEHSV